MVSQLAQKVGHLPQQYDRENKSTAALLKEAGFLEPRAAVSVEEMEQLLRDEPDLVRLWLRRGGDQRFAGGWGIEQIGREYRVLNFGDGRSLSFRDRMQACAEFVVRYVGFISRARAGRRR
jgi:hypothetical protein